MLVAEKQLDMIDMLEPTSPDELAEKQLQAIKNRAIQLWGEEKWLATLVKEYSKITNADPQKRYTQIKRLFEAKDCQASTLNGLMMAVNCRLKLICFSVEEQDF